MAVWLERYHFDLVISSQIHWNSKLNRHIRGATWFHLEHQRKKVGEIEVFNVRFRQIENGANFKDFHLYLDRDTRARISPWFIC